MNRVFCCCCFFFLSPVRSPGLAARSPRPGPRPGQARAGRADSGPGPTRSPPAPASSAHESPGPAAIPPRCGSAAQASPGAWPRPPRPQSLRHRGSRPGLRRRGRLPSAPASPPLTRISLVPKELGRRLQLVAEPGPRLNPRPAKVCLRPSAAGAAPPGAAYDTAPASSSSPARPPALLPPPPAPRNLRPLAFPPRLPALTASPAPATVGEKLVGEGRNAPPWASGAGEPGNRRRHLPTSPRRGRGPEISRPARPLPRGCPPRWPRIRERGVFLPESPWPLPPSAAPSAAGRTGSSSRF